jgi:hypothetical protein
MKKLSFLLMIFLAPILLAQDFESEPTFSKVYFGVLSGINFNTIPTAGAAISFEIKSNVTSQINAKFLLGYSVLYDDNSYEVKYYKYQDFDSQYHTRLLEVDRVKYTIVPVSLGAEYVLLNNKTSPFALFEIGYNFSSSLAEGVTHDGIAGAYGTIEEVPEEYRNTAPPLEDGSSFTLGIGAGIKYMLTQRMDLNIRYVYHYNESIINNSQVLIGLTF